VVERENLRVLCRGLLIGKSLNIDSCRHDSGQLPCPTRPAINSPRHRRDPHSSWWITTPRSGEAYTRCTRRSAPPIAPRTRGPRSPSTPEATQRNHLSISERCAPVVLGCACRVDDLAASCNVIQPRLMHAGRKIMGERWPRISSDFCSTTLTMPRRAPGHRRRHRRPGPGQCPHRDEGSSTARPYDSAGGRRLTRPQCHPPRRSRFRRSPRYMQCNCMARTFRERPSLLAIHPLLSASSIDVDGQTDL
jgi:hypothetical protein